jgi:protein-arginine kinase activator protein McsA
MDSKDKQLLYAKINVRIKLCVENEFYEAAALIRDALKNIE